jgi:thiosulfate dehydrogenase [quinone] large subunit
MDRNNRATRIEVPMVPTNHAPEQHERSLAYVLMRAFTGLDFFGHGFSRVFTGTHLNGFAHGMVKNMAATPLPAALTLATGYAVPCVELAVGILLLLGMFTRQALLLAFALMFVLMFGITLKQDWATASEQLVYGLVLAALFFGRAAYDRSWKTVFAR